MFTRTPKSFTAEFRDLYPERSDFTRAEVFYEADTALTIEDEFGRTWSLKELSIADLEILQRNLVQSAVADANADAAGYSDDPWDEFDRAEERVTNAQERYV